MLRLVPNCRKVRLLQRYSPNFYEKPHFVKPTWRQVGLPRKGASRLFGQFLEGKFCEVRVYGVLGNSVSFAAFATIDATAPVGSAVKGGFWRHAPVSRPPQKRRGPYRTSDTRRPHEGSRSPRKARRELLKVLVQRGDRRGLLSG